MSEKAIAVSMQNSPQNKDKASPKARVRRNSYVIARGETLWGWIYLAPFILLTAVFVVYPIYGSVKIAFYNYSGIGNPTQYVGLRHFITVINDPYFWNAFKNTLTYVMVLVGHVA